MNKVFNVVISVLILFGAIFFYPTFTFAHEEGPPHAHDALTETENTEAIIEKVDSFELFWPIVAGKTRSDKLYVLKKVKEKVRGAFIFSKYKKVDYKLNLSEKRLVEAEKLLNEEDIKNAQKTLEDAHEAVKDARSLLTQVEAKGQNTTDLKNAFKSSLDKQIKLTTYLVNSKSDETKSLLEGYTSSLQSILDSLN